MALNSHFCRRYRIRKAKTVTDRIGVLRDYIANVESARRSYRAALDGEKPTKLSENALREGIARTTRRLTELRAELKALES